MPFYRRLSPVECIYLAQDRKNHSPFVNQIIVEGNGELDPAAWQAAIAQVTRLNPSLRLRGRWGWRYWDDQGPPPKLVIVNDCAWDGMSSSDCPCAGHAINPRIDATSEVWLLKPKNSAEKSRIIFRSHHAITDGIGAFLWMENIFCALRGEALQKTEGRFDEQSIAERFGSPPYHPPAGTSLPIFAKQKPLELESDEASQCHWIRCSIASQPGKALPHVIGLLNQKIRKSQTGQLLVRIPVDLRRYIKESAPQSGNCTSVIDLEISPDDNAASIQHKIVKAMRHREDLAFANLPSMKQIRWKPKFLLRRSKQHIQELHRRGNFRFTANLSYIRAAPITHYNAPNFQASAVYGIPIPMTERPCFIGVCFSNEKLEITIGMPKSLASFNDLVSFSQYLQTAWHQHRESPVVSHHPEPMTI